MQQSYMGEVSHEPQKLIVTNSYMGEVSHEPQKLRVTKV